MIYKDDKFERKKGKGREVFTQFACNFLMIYKDNRLFFLLLSMCKHHRDMAADVKSILRERSLRKSCRPRHSIAEVLMNILCLWRIDGVGKYGSRHERRNKKGYNPSSRNSSKKHPVDISNAFC